MKNYLKLIYIIIFFISFNIYSQEKKVNWPKKNFVYAELLGNGIFGSINYERQILSKPMWSIRAGVGYYSENTKYVTLPVSVQYTMYLKNSNYLEFGAGYTWAHEQGENYFKSEVSNPDIIHNYFLIAGYKQIFDNHWVFRATFTPLIKNNYDVKFPWFGVSVGKMF